MAQQNPTPTEIIDALGGTPPVARMCEVTDSAVSQWRTNGIPKSRLMFLRLAAPEIFAGLDARNHADTDRRKKPERRKSPA